MHPVAEAVALGLEGSCRGRMDA